MKFLRFLFLACGMALLGTAAVAQEPADEASVWRVVEQQWASAQDDDDGEWIDELIADDFSGWPNSSPSPRSKESIRMWNKVESSMGTGVEHELYPLSIVVHGDTAVAHYLYSSANADEDGEIEITHGRYTDVLVRVDGEWKFIAWSCGSDSSD